jgi:hypothetical protein
MTWKTEHVDLDILGVEVGDARLRLGYRVTNLASSELFLVNRLFRVDKLGHVTVDPGLVYALVVDGVLQLSKELLEPPEWASPEGPPVPYLTRLGAGESCSEELDLALPVREHYPWTHFKLRARPLREVTALAIVLTVGYLAGYRSEWLRRVTVGGKQELAIDRGFARQVHAAVTSAPVEAEVPCLEPTPLEA